MLDEIFDSSLDGQGMDDFFKIIKQFENENIFIISHKGDILFDKFFNIIKYEKYKNFTRYNKDVFVFKLFDNFKEVVIP